jgi:hypothetical protein
MPEQMTCRMSVSFYDTPRRAFDLLPDIFPFGQYHHAPDTEQIFSGGAWFTCRENDIEVTFFLARQDLNQYRKDKCLI